MFSYEIKQYLKNRNYELSSDEILDMIDISKNPQIDHIIYDNSIYQMWDNDGNYFKFKSR